MKYTPRTRPIFIRAGKQSVGCLATLPPCPLSLKERGTDTEKIDSLTEPERGLGVLLALNSLDGCFLRSFRGRRSSDCAFRRCCGARTRNEMRESFNCHEQRGHYEDRYSGREHHSNDSHGSD